MKLKRFAPIMVLVAILTMGAVFAAWAFADGKAGTINSKELQFAMEGTTSAGPHGTYTVEVPDIKFFSIDQNSRTAVPDMTKPDYAAVLVINPNAKLTIRFTPNDSASEDVTEYGILTNAIFSFKKGVTQEKYTMDDNGNYVAPGESPARSLQIITLSGENIVINSLKNKPSNEDGKNYWTKQADGSFTFELNATDIANHVKLNNDETLNLYQSDDENKDGFVLHNIDEYNAFGACLDSYTCALVVKDATDTQSNT